MSKNVEVKSNLFPACQNCQAAIDTGEDQIIRALTPDVGYTPPSKKSAFVATVTCGFDTGVQVPKSQIVYEVDVQVNGKLIGSETGPMDRCPGLTGDLVTSYCRLGGIGVSELATTTGLSEEHLKDLIDGKREFDRDNIVDIIHVLENKVIETRQTEKFTFNEKKNLLESAGYGLVAGYIDPKDIPPGCVGAMPISNSKISN